jgi:hypothetical protein
MSLEDSKAVYEIQITRSGDGAALAVQDFKNLDSAAKTVSTSVGSSSESLTKLRETSLMARESMHELNSIALLAGGSRFPQLTEATIAARMGLMSVRTAAQMTGASLETVAPIVALIATAAGVGILAWTSYRDEMKKTEEQAKSMADALQKMPAMVAEISKLANAGLVTPKQSEMWMQLLGRTNPSFPKNYSVLGEAQSYTPGPTIPPPYSNKISGDGLASMGIVTPDSIKAVQKQMQEAGLTDTENRLNPQIEALEKLKALQEAISIETLDGYDKERAAAKKNYDDRIAQIQELALIAGQKYSPDQQTALKASEDAVYQKKLSDISAAQEAEMAKRAAAAAAEGHRMVLAQQRQADEELKAEQEARQQESLDMTKQFYQEEKLYTLTSKQDKKTILDTELQDHLDFNANMMLDYRITLDQMAEMDNEARIKYQQGLNNLEQKEQLHTMTMRQMELQTAQNFASGFADAFVSFVDGTKSAEQAFGEFAASFLEQIATMIIQQEILNAIKAAGFFSGGGTASSGGSGDPGGELALAFGGVRMAASGLPGVSSVSSPTYFPKFNVVAGEAGHEMLTVLSRPRMMDIGGMSAVVGKAGNNTLAITNAADLANRGISGSAVIEVRPAAGYEANIVESAIQGAVLKVTSDMSQHTPLRQAVKQATA